MNSDVNFKQSLDKAVHAAEAANFQQADELCKELIKMYQKELSNLVFAKEGIKLPEIFNENLRLRPDSGFLRIASDKKLKHLVMFGKSTGNDILIDLEKKINVNYPLTHS